MTRYCTATSISTMLGSAVSTRDLYAADFTPWVSTLVTDSIGHGKRQPQPLGTVWW